MAKNSVLLMLLTSLKLSTSCMTVSLSVDNEPPLNEVLVVATSPSLCRTILVTSKESTLTDSEKVKVIISALMSRVKLMSTGLMVSLM